MSKPFQKFALKNKSQISVLGRRLNSIYYTDKLQIISQR